MIRGLYIERQTRIPLKTVVCDQCGFIIYKQRVNRKWDGRIGIQSRRHCSDCQLLFLNARHRAHYRINRLIGDGAMESWKGKSCIDCGSPAVCHDLRDYSHPEKAVPVCKRCNNLRGPAILGEKYAKR